jgi:hypothetical protein
MCVRVAGPKGRTRHLITRVTPVSKGAVAVGFLIASTVHVRRILPTPHAIGPHTRMSGSDQRTDQDDVSDQWDEDGFMLAVVQGRWCLGHGTGRRLCTLPAPDWRRGPGGNNTIVLYRSYRKNYLWGDLNSLAAIDGHDRQLINELLCSLVTSTIFVRC